MIALSVRRSATLDLRLEWRAELHLGENKWGSVRILSYKPPTYYLYEGVIYTLFGINYDGTLIFEKEIDMLFEKEINHCAKVNLPPFGGNNL